MNKKSLFFVLMYCFYASCLFSQEFEVRNVKGKINITKVDDFLTLRAQVVSEEAFFIDKLNYNFVVLKKGITGNYSKNNQSNDFSLEPNEEKQLSTVKVNIKKGEELKAFLFIKYNEKLIHRDTLFLGQKNKATKRRKKIDEQQYLIRGIVIDEAITRIGKDYHDYFYKEYLVTGKNYPFIIKIVEKPAMGRSSMISIEVDGKKLHEFFARPTEDYLKSNVVYAMRKLRNYNQRRKTTFQNKI